MTRSHCAAALLLILCTAASFASAQSGVRRPPPDRLRKNVYTNVPPTTKAPEVPISRPSATRNGCSMILSVGMG